MVDEQKLRQLAEAATPGPWSAFVVGNTVSVDIGDKPTGASKCIVHWMGFDSCDLPKKAWKANARLIAAANPAAILALLDELHALRSERTAWRVSAENAEAAVKQARIDALEEAKQAVSAEEILEVEDNADDAYNCGVIDCVRAIESLKGKA